MHFSKYEGTNILVENMVSDQLVEFLEIDAKLQLKGPNVSKSRLRYLFTKRIKANQITFLVLFDRDDG